MATAEVAGWRGMDLAIAEVALAMVLLVGAGLMINSILAVAAGEAGHRREQMY